MLTKKLALGSFFAGRYNIDSVLGEGGMGAVYRVQDQALAETVALKILAPPAEGAQQYAEMFRQEVKLSRRITHANVVHVYDIGEDDGLLYMTMEVIDGITLRKAMCREETGRLPIAEALRVALALANGLAAVHAQGIVHRDLKPGNVMICKTGRVVLADFGIASQVDIEHPAMRGKIFGTLSYMAPEQLKKAPPSVRTDIFSFGMVLLEMVTGGLPARGGPLATPKMPIDVDLHAARVEGDAETLSTLETLLRRCLSEDPTHRPESAEELSRALGVFSTSTPTAESNVRSRPPATPFGDIRSDRTAPLLAALAAQGISDEVAQEYIVARNDSRLYDTGHVLAAFERLESCVQQEPRFVQAIAQRAVTAVRCWFFDHTRTPLANWEEVATKYVQEAMIQAPGLSDTHLAAGMLATQRFEMKLAARSLVRALQIDAESHEAQEYLGNIQCETGLVDDGLSRLVYAATAIPLRPVPCLVQSRCLALLGRFDEADKLFAEANRRFGIPNFGGILTRLRTFAWRGGKGTVSLSISERTAIREKGWKVLQHYADAISGTLSSPELITSWFRAAAEGVSNLRVLLVMRQITAEMLMLVGDEPRTLATLADCARSGLIDILWLDRCPLFDPLRGSTRFQEIRTWVWLNAVGVWS